jgi:hypothetical protein
MGAELPYGDLVHASIVSPVRQAPIAQGRAASRRLAPATHRLRFQSSTCAQLAPPAEVFSTGRCAGRRVSGALARPSEGCPWWARAPRVRPLALTPEVQLDEIKARREPDDDERRHGRRLGYRVGKRIHPLIARKGKHAARDRRRPADEDHRDQPARSASQHQPCAGDHRPQRMKPRSASAPPVSSS